MDEFRTSTLGLAESELILTSADFGDAYLRDGWASQYIEDRMRLNTMVLVGYAAEDPALRLLLETLDADRERFRDLQEVYAIERKKNGSKGIKPIEFADYDAIYATLIEWSRYSLQPAAYGRARIANILGIASAVLSCSNDVIAHVSLLLITAGTRSS